MHDDVNRILEEPLEELIESMDDASVEERRVYAAYESEAAVTAFKEATGSCAALGEPAAADVEKVQAIMRIGFERVSYNCHHDYNDNVILALHGRREVVLWPPSEGPRLYLHDDEHPSARQSRINFDAPDYAAYPLAASAQALRLTLEPGEALVLPMLWFHHIRSSVSPAALGAGERPPYWLAVNFFCVRSITGQMARAAKLSPWNVQPALHFGAAAFNASEFGKAATHYRAATRLRPSLPSAHFNTALSLRHDGGRLDEAAAPLRHALELAPTYPDAIHEKAQQKIAVSAYGEAVHLLRRVRKLEPQHEPTRAALPEQLANHGGALLASGDGRGAEKLIRSALKLNPQHSNSYNNLAAALSVSGDLPTASRAYRAALSLNPADSMLYFRLGSVLAQLEGGLFEASVALTHSTLLLPHLAHAYYNLGRVASLSNEPETAKAHFAMAASLDPVKFAEPKK